MQLGREFLSGGVPEWRFALVRDVVRNHAYDAALRRAIRPVMCRLEIGSGILAMVAARAGAAEVVSCEINPFVAETARLNGPLLSQQRKLRAPSVPTASRGTLTPSVMSVYKDTRLPVALRLDAAKAAGGGNIFHQGPKSMADDEKNLAARIDTVSSIEARQIACAMRGIALYVELNLLPLPQMDTAETACRRQELDALLEENEKERLAIVRDNNRFWAQDFPKGEA